MSLARIYRLSADAVPIKLKRLSAARGQRGARSRRNVERGAEARPGISKIWPQFPREKTEILGRPSPPRFSPYSGPGQERVLASTPIPSRWVSANFHLRRQFRAARTSQIDFEISVVSVGNMLLRLSFVAR